MIKFPAKHLFEAKAPMLEDHEEEIIYTHPNGEFKCNQLGAIYFDEVKYSLLENINGSYMRSNDGKNLSFGTKGRIVWECYKGEVYPKRHSPRIYQVNGNVYDFTEENLVLGSGLTSQEQRALNSSWKEFSNKSIEHLIKMEERWALHGVSKEELWSMLVLPYWLLGARRKHDGEKSWGMRIGNRKRKKSLGGSETFSQET